MCHECVHRTVVCKTTLNAYLLLVVQELMMAKVYRLDVKVSTQRCFVCAIVAFAKCSWYSAVQLQP